jgi:hypothetical protein
LGQLSLKEKNMGTVMAWAVVMIRPTLVQPNSQHEPRLSLTSSKTLSVMDRTLEAMPMVKTMNMV